MQRRIDRRINLLSPPRGRFVLQRNESGWSTAKVIDTVGKLSFCHSQ